MLIDNTFLSNFSGDVIYQVVREIFALPQGIQAFTSKNIRHRISRGVTALSGGLK
jgi:hypothetical protein